MDMRYINLLLVVVLAAVVCGCASGEKPSQPAMDAANVTADRMFNALNTGDFVAFSENFSPAMTSAVNQTEFNIIAGKLSGQYGKYVSRSPVPSASVTQGYNVFLYDCQFEKGKLTLQLTMNSSNVTRVEGFFYR